MNLRKWVNFVSNVVHKRYIYDPFVQSNRNTYEEFIEKKKKANRELADLATPTSAGQVTNLKIRIFESGGSTINRLLCLL